MNKNLILKKGDRIQYINSFGKKDTITIGFDDKEMNFLKLENIEILKVDRLSIKYETIYEKKSILDEKEKEYLSFIIKPFRDEIKSITKYTDFIEKYEWISIEFFKQKEMNFPIFLKKKMYKGMIANREYTLEELGL